MDTLVIDLRFRLLRPATDFHRLVGAHAGRTKKGLSQHAN